MTPPACRDARTPPAASATARNSFHRVDWCLLFARLRGSAAGNVNRGFPSAHAVSAIMYYPVQRGLLGYWELARTGGVGPVVWVGVRGKYPA
jgi:hypothetical protein